MKHDATMVGVAMMPGTGSTAPVGSVRSHHKFVALALTAWPAKIAPMGKGAGVVVVVVIAVVVDPRAGDLLGECPPPGQVPGEKRIC